MRMAEEKFSRHLVNLHTSLITRINDADERLRMAREESETPLTQQQDDAAVALRVTQCKSAIRDTAKALDSCIRCAQTFDETGSTSDLIQALREAVRTNLSSLNAELLASGLRAMRLQVA